MELDFKQDLHRQRLENAKRRQEDYEAWPQSQAELESRREHARIPLGEAAIESTGVILTLGYAAPEAFANRYESEELNRNLAVTYSIGETSITGFNESFQEQQPHPLNRSYEEVALAA